MVLKALVLSGLVSLIIAEDVRRAFFVLQENKTGLSLVRSVLQDQKVSQCTKDDKCQFVVKNAINGEKSSNKWYKITIGKRTGKIDCLNLKLAGETQSGVFPITVNEKVEQISCDMTTDGGGWTVFQRRANGEVNFHRNWKDYKTGFGNRRQEFWLGLDLIHYMISQSESEMRIDLTDYKGYKLFARYGRAEIEGESLSYMMTLTKYSGTAGNSFPNFKRVKFSTYDRDNDGSNSLNCAKSYTGGFWFDSCFLAHLNALYPKNDEFSAKYISWFAYRRRYGTIRFTEMKFRRRQQHTAPDR